MVSLPPPFVVGKGGQEGEERARARGLWNAELEGKELERARALGGPWNVESEVVAPPESVGQEGVSGVSMVVGA
jgi:hypothetical protein